MKFLNVIFWLFIFSMPVSATDSLQWLRDDSRSKTDVLDYLHNENKQTDAFKVSLKSEVNTLLNEWQNNQPEKSDKPWKIKGNNEYSITTHKGQRQLVTRTLVTKKVTPLFNISIRSEAFNYYRLGGWALNNSGTALAIAEDTTGSEQYKISIVDLKTNTITALIDNTEPNILWSNDDRSLFLIKQEKQTLRPFQLIQFTLSNSQSHTVSEETNPTWLMSLYQSSDHRYAVIQSNNDNSSEQRLLNLTNGQLSEPIRPRVKDVEYYLDLAHDKVFINSNVVNKRFALYSVSIEHLFNPDYWKILYLPTDKKPLKDFYLFASGAVISVGDGQQAQLIYLDNKGKIRHTETITTSGQVAWVSRVGDYNSNAFYIRSMSMIQPPKWEKVNVSTLNRHLYSQDKYPNINPSHYVTEQILIKQNGVELPITLAYRKDKLSTKSPVFLYGYGAYGVTMKPYFMPQILSLLDRGVIYAIAHVRGGGYKGEAWYNAGRGINRQHAADDFITAANAMHHYQQGSHDIYALGSSAGGTLVATAINQQPNAFKGAALNVPFVDVVNSMSDTSLPLTLQQYSEWGNPTIPEELASMKQVDPYLNITQQAYPPLLVQVGLHDRRVPYWEGAKYLSKVRAMSTATAPYLLATHFNQGHSMDRREALTQQAFEYSFLLSLTHN